MDTPAPLKLNTFGLTKLQIASLSLAFIVCVFGLYKGIASGLAERRSMTTYKNALAVAQALNYYKSDQEVYPTQDLYENHSVLVPFYLSEMPQPVNSKGICRDMRGFSYSQPAPKQFKLQYCLEKSVGGRQAGLNTITEKDIQ